MCSLLADMCCAPSLPTRHFFDRIHDTLETFDAFTPEYMCIFREEEKALHGSHSVRFAEPIAVCIERWEIMALSVLAVPYWYVYYPFTIIC
jgi:hypothetical protein